MTRVSFVVAALALSAFVATPVFAQSSEPAAAEARDPNFSIYSSGGYRPTVSQSFDANAMAGTRMSMTPNRMHHAPIRHR